MQNWQFYLHMLALCVIVLLLYLFFREYKTHNSKHPTVETSPVGTSRLPFAAKVPLSHAHIQTMQSVATLPTVVQCTPQVSANIFETDSNLDRELSSEINDLCLTQDANGDAHSDAGSHSNASSSSQKHTTAGSPIRQVIEFLPKKSTKRKNARTSDAT